jgi:hypothetical protein
LRDHSQNAHEVDRLMAGLLFDLKARGLLKGHARALVR